jgi:hypothetical protein
MIINIAVGRHLMNVPSSCFLAEDVDIMIIVHVNGHRQ